MRFASCLGVRKGVIGMAEVITEMDIGAKYFRRLRDIKKRMKEAEERGMTEEERKQFRKELLELLEDVIKW